MGIRTKIMIAMITVAVVCIISLGLLCVLSIDAFVSDFNDTQLAESHNLASALLEQHSEEAVLASSLAAEDAQLIKAMEDCLAGGDRQALVNQSIALMTAVGVDFITITDSEGNVLARAHEPNNFGDSVINQANVKSALQGKQYVTTEKGTAVKLSVRCGTPVYDEAQNLIGVVSLGYRLDQSEFVDYIKRMTNTEVTIFLGDTRISTTVSDEKGGRAVGTPASEAVSKTVLAGNDYVGFANVLGKQLFAYYSPIRDAEGTILGMLFVGLDTSATDDHRARNVSLLLFESTLFIILSTLGALFVSGRIARPIREVSAAAKQLAVGDLSVDISVSASVVSKDETIQLKQAFAEMVQANRERAELISTVARGDLSGHVRLESDRDVVGLALNELLEKNNAAFTQMNNAAAQLDMASSQIADGAQSLSQGANEQAVTIERLHLGLKELSERTTENAGQARKAASLSESVKALAEKGSGQMNHMMDAVDQISKASTAIEKVMKVIDDIAFQTNILALNAAVEAARAGQHGKGFAVVAEEVRNLAAKSADAAKDTGTLIANSIEKAKLGAQISTDTAASFADIVKGINESSVIVERIAKFMQAQNNDLSAVTKGVDEIGAVVNSVSSAAEESAASSEEMSAQATAMAATLAEYKLRENQELPVGASPRLAMPPKRD